MMNPFILIAITLVTQLLLYVLIVRQIILSWGATKDEIKRPMAGDKYYPSVSATRAVTINASPEEVWKWITQLGADRRGFFSYAFIERILGYRVIDTNSEPNDTSMEVGRVIPGTIDNQSSFIKYNFKVLDVDPGRAFVLEKWGTFEVNEIEPGKTRLIVRTNRQANENLIEQFIGEPMHFIMERRMLIGIKARVEAGAGVRLSSTADYLWFLGLVFSGVGFVILPFISSSVCVAMLTVLFGLGWLLSLMVFKPTPKYPIILFLLELLTGVWIICEL